MPDRPDQAAALSDAVNTAYRMLLTLQAGATAGWYQYVGANPRSGRYLVSIAGRRRLLFRDEVIHWVDGVRRARRAGVSLPGDDITAPEMLTRDQAAAILGMTSDGINYHLGRGKLYPLFVLSPAGGMERMLFAAQVYATIPGNQSRDPVTQWHRIRALLPPPLRYEQVLGGEFVPAASPDPLPIPRGWTEFQRRVQALKIGHSEGWFAYVAGSADVYTVEVLRRQAQRSTVTLPAAGVLPWTLGVADHYGHPELVAYREGLG